MITLTVVSYNGQPSDGRLSAQFDEMGGTIGRADTNQLVLPDPDRAISRVHAQVVFRSGAFACGPRQPRMCRSAPEESTLTVQRSCSRRARI